MPFLECNPKALEKKLRIQDDDCEELFEDMSFLNTDQEPGEATTRKIITPVAGIVVKTFTKKGRNKVFINICRSDEVADKMDDNKIPMYVNGPRNEPDKEKVMCTTYDVTINSDTYLRMLRESTEQQLAAQVRGHKKKLPPHPNLILIKQSIEAQTGEEFTNDCRILNNVKRMGKIRDIVIECEKNGPKSALITELPSVGANKQRQQPSVQKPDFNLILIEQPEPIFVSEIDLKNIKSAKDVELRVEVDRVKVKTSRASVRYELEYYLPEFVYTNLCQAEFDSATQLFKGYRSVTAE